MLKKKLFQVSFFPQVIDSQRLFFTGLIGLLLGFGGCANLSKATNEAVSVAFAGAFHGGQQPVSGASIQLYAITSSGTGAASQALLAQPVTTNQYGEFTLQPNSYTCPSSSAIVYMTALGGNPGLAPGVNNAAIAAMAVLGTCGSIGPSTYVNINEITTIGSLWPLASFASSYQAIGYSNANATAFNAAVALIPQLMNATSGTAPGLAVPAGATVPVARLNTLASIVGSCINSAGGSAGDGSACGSLFQCATLKGTNPPTNTLDAMLAFASNPTMNVTNLFYLAPAFAVFQPTLTVAPTDWTLPVITAPVISPAAGLYNSSVTASLATSTSGAVIHYTVDGTIPTASSSAYTAPITLAQSATVNALTFDEDMTSSVVTAAYTVAPPVAETLAPLSVSLQPLQTQIFPASVANSSNTVVVWSLSPALGSVSSAGVYTAPTSFPADQTVAITATSVADATKSVTALVNLVSGSPAKLSFTEQPFGTQVGSPLSPAFTVAVEDHYGNLADSTMPVSVALSGGTASTSLQGTVQVSAVAGVATFSNLVVPAIGTNYQLIASGGSLPAATSQQFVIAPALQYASLTPPAVNACASTYDKFYEQEPGVYAYWALCEAGTNANIYDYIGKFDLKPSTTGWRTGTVFGGQTGPVSDGETATQGWSLLPSVESQGIPLNTHQGTIAIWVNSDQQPWPVNPIWLGAVGGNSNIGLQTYGSGTTVCFAAEVTDSSGNTVSIPTSNCNYTPNTWHRVVMTWDDSSLSLYVDGVPLANAGRSAALDNTPFYYRLFPGCCNAGKQMTLAKASVANQEWTSIQVMQDFAADVITPPTAGVYVGTSIRNMLGTIHQNVLGFGDVNTNLASPAPVAAFTAGLQSLGVTATRYAGSYGGINADLENWQGGVTCTATQGVTSPAQNLVTLDNLDNFEAKIAQPLSLSVGFTVNYGTNPPYCNAGGDPIVNGANLVQYANVQKGYNIKYWEIGNEQYNGGASETDFHPNPALGSSYNQYEPAFYTAMKAQDSTIQIAIPVGEATFGWQSLWDLPVMAGAQYDAIVWHDYPLADPITDGNTLYPDRVATTLNRTHGSLLGLQTELLNAGKSPNAIWVTEWNADVSGNQWSQQTMGAVMPLFSAMQLAEFMQAGVPYATWWAQSSTSNACLPYYFDASAWSTYAFWGCGSNGLVYTEGMGDEMLVGLKPADLMPAARGLQVLSESGFVAENETMLRTITDEQNAPWLAAYGATHSGSHAVLLINRDQVAHTVPVQLQGQTSGSGVNQWTYGVAQFDATYAGDWSVQPIQSSGDAWSGTYPAILPPWSVNVIIFQ